ncbi:MAG TPA: hypothetical protein VL974_13505 [Magnetospirillum sp.]|nr:hypothetical protein [Magnetospirillum sp.]
MTAATAENSAFAELTALGMGLVLLCAGTVALIGGTGALMWMFGL